jgi:membrane protease subunit HflC
MRTTTTVFILIVALLFAAMGSMFVVRESETAIVLNLGKVVRTDLKPGLHFKWPLVEEVRKFDARILTITATDEPYLTVEQQDVRVDFFANWRIVDVRTYYRAASGGNEEAATTRLTPIVTAALRNVINRSTLRQLAEGGRAALSADLIAGINTSAKELGVEVIDVRIKRIDLPDDSSAGQDSVLDRVYARMRADRTEEANRKRAEGQEAAAKIRAEAEREQRVILANAERDAQKARGEGDARAAQIAAAAYGQDAEFYAFYRSLEAYRGSMADGRTTIVLDPDSEFLRYFGQDGR